MCRTARPTQCMPGQAQNSCRAPVTLSVLTPTLSRVRRSEQLHIRCLRSTVPALAVPCSSMPMVTSVSQMAAYQVCSHPGSVCLVDHVLHGNCPDVTTFGSERRAVAYYCRGEWQARCYEARCVHPPWGQACPQLGALTGPDPWGSTLPYRVYHTPQCATYVCICLTSLPVVAPGDRASLTSDRRS